MAAHDKSGPGDGYAGTFDARRPQAIVAPLADLGAARELWEPLAQRTRNIFSTWDWADVWWRHYGAGRTLELGSVRVGTRVAILPICAETRPGFTVRRLIGHGPADQLGPVADPADGRLAADGLAAVASSRGVLLIERLASGEDAGLRGWRVIHEEVAPVIDLAADGSWEAFLASRSRTFREQARRRARRVQRAGISFRLAQDPSRLERDFDALVLLHRARWGAQSGAFGGEREAFHREFAARALERGWLRLWIAEADGTPIAAWYGFRFAGVESYYQAGRDPQWDRLSVGASILEHSIREAFADGMSEYRLLRGDEAYKRHYAHRTTTLRTIVVPRGLVAITIASAAIVIARARAGRRFLGSFQD